MTLYPDGKTTNAIPGLGSHSFTCPYCGIGYSSTHFCQKQMMSEQRVVHTLDPQIVILLGRLVAAVERLVA